MVQGAGKYLVGGRGEPAGRAQCAAAVERPLTEADFEQDIALSEFDLDFDSIEVPKGQLDGEAVDDLVSQFMNKVT